MTSWLMYSKVNRTTTEMGLNLDQIVGAQKEILDRTFANIILLISALKGADI